MDMNERKPAIPPWGKYKGGRPIPGQMFDMPEFLIPVTPELVFGDFKMRHPTLAKHIVKWKMRGVYIVRVWLTNDMILDHDYREHAAVIIRDGRDEW